MVRSPQPGPLDVTIGAWFMAHTPLCDRSTPLLCSDRAVSTTGIQEGRRQGRQRVSLLRSSARRSARPSTSSILTAHVNWPGFPRPSMSPAPRSTATPLHVPLSHADAFVFAASGALPAASLPLASALVYTALGLPAPFCARHDYAGHNYIGHNYVGHNYVGHNYIGP